MLGSFSWAQSSIYCPICDEQLHEHTVISEKCCKNVKLENNNQEYVWVYCGQVDKYDTVNEFVDFMRINIRGKFVYHRKYHFYNMITTLCSKDNMQISSNDKNIGY